MTPEQNEEIGNLALSCKGFHWLPGMCDAKGDRVLSVSAEGIAWESGEDRSHYPDCTDPANIGCFEHLVREAWGFDGDVPESNELEVSRYGGGDAIVVIIIDNMWAHDRYTRDYDGGLAAALVHALKAADDR